jgi:glycosyltransferase involved in cell wall biosynthesis
MSNRPKEKKITFINQASGYLMVDIVNAFSDTGYQCVLITGLLVERNRPLNKEVIIRKIIRYNNTSPLKRIFTWGWGTLQILGMILFHYHKDHLFIVSNPPTSVFLPMIVSNSFTLLIFDIYPDAITELGILKKKSLIIKLWTKINKKVYLKAEKIFTITEGMRDQLRSYAGDKEITIVPLWSDNEFLQIIPSQENFFIKKYNLTGKFVVLYSGNIGLSNDVEVLVDVAKIVNARNIAFVIIGGGARKRQLEDRVKKEGINNFLILQWQDVAQLPYTLSSANIAVVTLGKGASKLSIPSKIYSLLSVGVPILGITGQDSDLRKFIVKYEIGNCFLPENKEEIADYIVHLERHPEKCANMSNNALQTSKFFTNKNTAKFLNSKFQF